MAVVSATLLGCVTVRAPVSTIASTIPVHDGRPEPQLELWLESNRQATPEESARASAQARAALDAALAGREADSPDELLVVRAQGVTRTSARRSDQHAAVAGIVLGAVVIVAAAVILVVTSSKGSGGGRGRGPSLPGVGHAHAPSAGGAAGHVARLGPGAFPRGAPAPHFRAVPAPVHPPRGAFSPVAMGRGHHHHGGDVAVGVYWDLDLVGPPAPLSPAPPEAYLVALPPPLRPGTLDERPLAAPPAVDGQDELELGDAEQAALEPPPDLEQLELPPPPMLAVDQRGFFEGDALVLEAVVVDRATGRPRWQKVVERQADPRDPRAVGAAVDDLLGDGGWAPAY
jgi:hypothetical protein